MSGYGAKFQEASLRRHIKAKLRRGMPEWIATYCESILHRANYRVERAKLRCDDTKRRREEERHINEILCLNDLLSGWDRYANGAGPDKQTDHSLKDPS